LNPLSIEQLNRSNPLPYAPYIVTTDGTDVQYDPLRRRGGSIDIRPNTGYPPQILFRTTSDTIQGTYTTDNRVGISEIIDDGGIASIRNASLDPDALRKMLTDLKGDSDGEEGNVHL
jgi:hypothetical protein